MPFHVKGGKGERGKGERVRAACTLRLNFASWGKNVWIAGRCVFGSITIYIEQMTVVQ